MRSICSSAVYPHHLRAPEGSLQKLGIQGSKLLRSGLVSSMSLGLPCLPAGASLLMRRVDLFAVVRSFGLVVAESALLVAAGSLWWEYLVQRVHWLKPSARGSDVTHTTGGGGGGGASISMPDRDETFAGIRKRNRLCA